MLTYKQFEILKLFTNKDFDSNDVKKYILSRVYDENIKDEISLIIKTLFESNYIENNKITNKGLKELEPYKVDNAIILAAGGAAKDSKSIYSLPKGLYVIDDEPLIERQIKQLKEAGISDITLVLGYRQELYLYLEEKYDVSLWCTPAIEKGNIVTLNSVAEKLSRTYICNCDNYFKENPFSKYEYRSFHSIVYKKECSKEIKVVTNDVGMILNSYIDNEPGDCFYGHAFLDEKFNEKFKKYLISDLNLIKVDMMFWEELMMKHIEQLEIYSKKYSVDFLYEFDSISELQNVNTLFINNVSDKIIETICEVFKCNKKDIKDIKIQDKGMTNIIITFIFNEEKYIFRYPGESSWELTSKEREVIAQNIATRLGLDDSCVYINKNGCKISKYRNNLIDLSKTWYSDFDLLKTCASKMKKLHDNTSLIENKEEMMFDSIAEGDRLMELASARKGNLRECFGYIRENAVLLKEYYEKDGWKKVLCHHDWKYDNILKNENHFDVIDWEYGSIDDPGSDLLRLIMDRDFDSTMVENILDSYFGTKTTKDQKMHVIAAFVPACYYWLGWLMYQESIGNNGYYWTILYYQTANKAIKYTKEYYINKYGK